MKHPILAILAVVLAGCTYSPQHIERMAKSTVAVSELDALLDGFVSLSPGRQRCRVVSCSPAGTL